MEHVKNLSKAQEIADLQARVDCLLRENGELKSEVAAREAQLQEAEALKVATFEELVYVREDRNKANAISWKVHNFVGHPGDVVNKARLYNKSVGQLGALPAPKGIWCLVDYNAKMEKLLKKI